MWPAVAARETGTAGGDLSGLSRDKDGETSRGSVVNLGALGVVTSVTLDVQPSFAMRQDVYLDLPMGQVKDHFEDIVAAGYSVSLFTDWQKGRVNEVWIKRRVEKGTTLTADPEFFGARRATGNVPPIAELSAENCPTQMGLAGPWCRPRPPSRRGAVLPRCRQLREYSPFRCGR